jgi:NADPH-dependent curcumin reductase CurA
LNLKVYLFWNTNTAKRENVISFINAGNKVEIYFDNVHKDIGFSIVNNLQTAAKLETLEK